MPFRRKASVAAALTLAQEMELRLGPKIRATRDGVLPNAFQNEDERRRAWFAHREALLEPAPNRLGRRCWGFWRYEFPGERDPIWETVQLIEGGFVGREELAKIHNMWRRRLVGIRDLAGCFDEPRRSQTYWLERRRSGIPDAFDRPDPHDYEFHADD
jgi:hypothetical protein